MRNTNSILVIAVFALISACNKTEEAPQIPAAQEESGGSGVADVEDMSPENPAEMSIAGIDSTEIVPGLSQRTLLQGEGAMAEIGQTAVVHYTGWLFDPAAENFRGNKFDTSVDRGRHFEFPLGGGGVIRGWDEGVVGMKIGEVRELTIAPEMGYGEGGAGGGLIPPNATLVFVVELADLKGGGAER